MVTKRNNGHFTSYFFRRLREDKIKPRRLNNPKGNERYTFSVANVTDGWKRDLYYDPRALRNLDYALRILPGLRKPLFESFDLVLEHEKVHAGVSSYQTYPAGKIKKIAEAAGREWHAEKLTENVANRGLVEHILKSHGIKSLRDPRARAVISDKISWYFVQSLIQMGDFRRFSKAGTTSVSPKNRSEAIARTLLARIHLKQLFTFLPDEIINEIVRKMKIRFTRIVDQANKKLQRAT